jgi:hypothetical protein
VRSVRGETAKDDVVCEAKLKDFKRLVRPKSLEPHGRHFCFALQGSRHAHSHIDTLSQA